MMRYRILVALFLLGILPALSQKSPVGSYILERIITPGGEEESFLPTTFQTGGKILITDIPFGTWKRENGKIRLSFQKPDFDGLYAMHQEKGVMTLQNEKFSFTYRAYHPEDNEKLPVLGVWKQTNSPENTLVGFSLPDQVVSVKFQAEMTETSKGTWLYVPGDQTLMIFGLMDELRGKGKIQTVDDEHFSFHIEGQDLDFERVKEAKPDLLSFREDDFPEDSDDSDQLPASWRDENEIKENFQHISSIQYLKKTYLTELGVFKTDTIVEKISVDEQYVKIARYQVNGKDSIQLKEIRKGGLYNRFNPFYPQEEPGFYRVAGKDKISIPAGTFDCTVVEGVRGEELYKYWMIDHLPGVYARIINDKPGEQRKYREYVLYDMRN